MIMIQYHHRNHHNQYNLTLLSMMIIDVHQDDNQVVPGGGQPWSLQPFGCGHKGSKITLPVHLISSQGTLDFLTAT